MSPAPAALLLAALAAAALLADRIVSVAAIALVLLLVCLRAPGGRRRMYLVGALGSGLAVFVLTPFVSSIGWHVIWSGPTVPVLGQLDITREELRIGLFQGLRLTAVALAFAAYALLLDHDRLVQSVRFARRSVLAMALATRLVPTLERDAAGLVEALRGRGVEVSGARGRARLLAPLLGRLARARAQPRRGDGGARLRPSRRDEDAAPRLEPARPGRARAGRRGRGDRSAVALATVRELAFTYPGEHEALRGVSLELEPGEVVALLGPSGGGKSTLLRALAGLVPHFHGGRFSGSVEVGGLDTRRVHPSDLAGTVATLFQDPEDQVVFTRVNNEVAFGLENLGTPPAQILPRAAQALAAVGAAHLAERPVAELSGGELQRVCLASVLALEPRLLLLDEPTSQLDPEGAATAIELARASGAAVVVSEQRPERVLDACDRVLFVADGRIRDGELPEAWLPREALLPDAEPSGPAVCRLDDVSFAYGAAPVVARASLRVGRGEIVALVGPNGSGKTTLAKLASGLLEPQAGSVTREGRACYLSQDPGRYLVKERADEEVALAVGGDLARARATLAQVGLAGFEDRHPRDLSSGERERLALAAVLVAEPDLLVLDEPTRGVDPPRKDELAALLRAQAPARATLVVTNDLVFAAEVADRVVSTAPERERAVA